MKLIEDCGNCILDTVSVHGCDEEKPCLIYIDDFAGISSDFMDAIADPSKHDTYIDLFNNAKKNALRTFKADLLSQFGKVKSFSKEVLKTPKGKPLIPPRQFFTADSYVGTIVNVTDAEDQVINVKFMRFYARNAGTVTFKLFSTVDGEIYSQSFQATVGINTIQIDKKFRIEYDGDTAILAIYSDTVQFNVMNCGGHTENCGCKCSKSSSDFSTSSISFSDPLQVPLNSYSQIADTAVCFDAVLECDLDNLICKEKSNLSLPFAYAVYLELILFQQTTPQYNLLSEINLEEIKATVKPEAKLRYWQSLARAVHDIVERVAEDSLCFSCTTENENSFTFRSAYE